MLHRWHIQYTPPRNDVFNLIRNDGTFGQPCKDWRYLHVKTQTLQYRDKVSHTWELWNFHKSPHNTRATHQRTLTIFKVATHHNTGATQGNFGKTQSPHTPQHCHTQGNFEKTQSLHTPQHRAHTQGNYFPKGGIFLKNQSLPVQEFFKSTYRDFFVKTNLFSTVAVRSAVKITKHQYPQYQEK